MGFPPFLDTPLLRTQKMKMIGISGGRWLDFCNIKKTRPNLDFVLGAALPRTHNLLVTGIDGKFHVNWQWLGFSNCFSTELGNNQISERLPSGNLT
jgi:hypothetical protein